MRWGYLYDQPTKDADKMNVDEWLLDTPKTKRQALHDLTGRGTAGVRKGDTLVVTARSKLGKHKQALRIEKLLSDMGVSLDIVPVESEKKPVRKGKRRKPTDAERKYGRALWTGVDEPADAIAAMSQKMGFEVDRQWMNYNLCLRDGTPMKKKKADK